MFTRLDQPRGGLRGSHNPRGIAAPLLLAGIALALSLTAPAPAALERLYHKKANLTTPNAPLLVDLVDSVEPELVLTDVKGEIRIYRSTLDEELTARNISSSSLTAPIVGDFDGDDFLDLAVGTGDGEVILMQGSSLREIAREKIGNGFAVQPTTVSTGQGQRDMLVITDTTGVVYGLQVDDAKRLQKIWEFPGVTTQSPLVVGSVRKVDALDVVATTSDGHVVLIDPFTGLTDKVLIQDGTAIPVSALLMDSNGDRLDEVVVSLVTGTIRKYTWDANLVPKLQLRWEQPIPSPPVGPPILLTKGASLQAYRIFQASASSVQVLEPLEGKIIAKDTTLYSGVNTEPALLPENSDSYPELAFGVQRSFHVTRNISEWIATGGQTLLATEEEQLGHDLRYGIMVGMAKPGDPLFAIGVSPDERGHVYAFKTTLQTSTSFWPTMTPWMTLGGSPSHNPMLDTKWAGVETQRRVAAVSTEVEWNRKLRLAMDAKNWSESEDLAEKLTNTNPHNAEYSSLDWEIWRKKNFIQIVIAIAAFLTVGGFTTYKVTQFLTYRRLRRRAEGAFARHEYDESRRFYQRLATKLPKNKKVAYDFAKVLVAQRDYSVETVDVYRKAHQAEPTDPEILNAFARSLLREPRTDAEAAEIYKRALTTYPEPAWLEYGIGLCELAAANYEEAGKRLRSALRGGVNTNDIYGALCDVYMKTRNFTAKTLPVFQQQHPSRRDDAEFLKAYLAASIEAKKMDQQVESLCQEVLDAVPNHVPAYLQLASILMQKNQPGTAVEEIHSALKAEPGNTEAVLLLATCYQTQNRKDDEALNAYRAALKVDPRNRETLRMMAAVFFERNDYNEEAISIYRRSHEHNPNDTTTLRALAQAALLSADHELSVRAIEALGSHGQLGQKLTEQLANAYIRLRIEGPNTEKIFRDSLLANPENPEYTAALTRVLVAQNRDEAECLTIYESHLRAYPNDISAGRQLAKTYIKANRYEHALETAQKFLKIAPDDDELQRLNALASLYGNKIDEAVSEYRRLLDRNPDDEQALVNLALAYGQKLRTDEEAVGYYRRALEIKADSDELHLAMARVAAMAKDAVGAVDSYKRALKAGENNEQKVIANIIAMLAEKSDLLRLRWFLIELLVSLGHLREALEQIDFIGKNHPGQTANILRALELILKKDPNNITALYQRGTMLLSTDDFTQAIRELERAYELQPASSDIQDKLVEAYMAVLAKKDDAGTRFKLARIHYSQQEYDAAIGHLQKTAQDYRWEAESTKLLGKCFTGKGMLDLALQEFKKLVVDEETKELLYDLAQRYESKKDLVGAKTVYRQLFAADIDYKDVKTRFEMLSGSTSDPMAFEKTSIVQQMSEEAARRYELLDELGRGAMGIVYRARDKELEEIVALKILPDNMSNNPEAVRRFKIEARNARKLSHPNIVRIHDIGEEMGRKYISMEYVEGSDLKKKVKSKPGTRLPLEVIVKYAMQTADALGYAHRLGIVHRDIKPANIMLSKDDDVKVTDFGIAKMMDQTGEGTMVGAVIGTPLYMSPEQVQGIPVDNRADIYSFGIMMYELFSGRPPFTEGDLAYQHIHRVPDAIPELPEVLWNIIAKCLEKKKESRWDKAEDVYDALREFKRSLAT